MTNGGSSRRQPVSMVGGAGGGFSILPNILMRGLFEDLPGIVMHTAWCCGRMLAHWPAAQHDSICVCRLYEAAQTLRHWRFCILCCVATLVRPSKLATALNTWGGVLRSQGRHRQGQRVARNLLF